LSSKVFSPWFCKIFVGFVVTVGVVPIDPHPISLPSVPIIDRRGELLLLVLALIALLVYDELGEG